MAAPSLPAAFPPWLRTPWDAWAQAGGLSRGFRARLTADWASRDAAVWEMLSFWFLHQAGFSITLADREVPPAPSHGGPDFSVVVGSRQAWIEATTIPRAPVLRDAPLALTRLLRDKAQQRQRALRLGLARGADPYILALGTPAPASPPWPDLTPTLASSTQRWCSGLLLGALDLPPNPGAWCWLPNPHARAPWHPQP